MSVSLAPTITYQVNDLVQSLLSEKLKRSRLVSQLAADLSMMFIEKVGFVNKGKTNDIFGG